MPSFTLYMAPRFTLSFIHQIFIENSMPQAFCWRLGYIAVIWFFQSISTQHLKNNIFVLTNT